MAERGGGTAVKWIVTLLVLAGVGYGAWWFWMKPKNVGPLYRTAVVTRGDVVQSVTANGQLNPVANVQVGSQISGMIQQLYADFNSSVTQNQIIAQLDPSTYRAAVHQAEADVTNAMAVLELAQVEARRADQLRKSQLLAEADYDKIIADLHQAEAQKQMRLAALERSQVDLNRCTIFAPTNGTVISRNVDVGQTVAASLSAPILFVIANDLRRMQIDAMVSEADIGGVEQGQPVTFTVDAFPTRAFTGKVIQIRNAPTTNQNVVTYDCVVAVDNSDLKLKPGMTANVSIILAEHPDVLKIPNSALRFRPPDAVEQKRGGMAGSASTNGSEGGERRGQWAGAGSAAGEGRGPRGGGGRGLGGAGGGRERRGDRSLVRTVYTLGSTNAAPGTAESKPVPRQVKLGISDGAYSEVAEGLSENDLIVVGSNAVEPPKTSPASSNPLGGGMRRF